jgi:ATPase subunit of ABC transporter with duplicated ATPase domains
MIDIDYEKITLFVGNYDFWVKSSELIQKQMLDSNKRKEEKIKELEDFIRRFSANASKSKQATSRKKSLEKIVLDEIKPSSRKYPFIQFDFEKPVGKEVISLEKVCYKDLLKNINITIRPDDKIAILGENELAKTALLKILAGSLIPDSGDRKVGSNIKISSFEKNHDSYFKDDIDLTEWLKNYSENKEESFVRGFLGRMLFSKDEVFKKVNVLSGGEKVRIMLSKMMLEKGNVLLFDEPTNHLDIESITSLNKALEKFKGCIVISTFDQEIIDTTCNRLIYIKKDGTIKDKQMTLEEFYQKFGEEL